MVVETLRSHEEGGLRTHRCVVINTCQGMILRVAQRCMPRFGTWKMYTLGVVEAWHQLHITINIRDSHKGLVGNLHL